MVSVRLFHLRSEIMSRDKLPVVAAVPNYNMAHSLGELLPQLAEQDYAAIFVLDDASTDESREVVRDFDKSINFVAGTENLGAGANRNRILGALAFDAIIHFVDADMYLETHGVPELAQEIASSDTVGFVGGLLKEKSGRQHPFNYGPRQCLRNDLRAGLQARIASLVETNPAMAAELREKFPERLVDYPNIQAEPQARPVFWSAESNLLIRSDVFAGIGGFDPALREHEVQDLAIRLNEVGLERRFDPVLSAFHKAILVRSGNRTFQMRKAEWQIARKYGLLKWLLSDGCN